MSPSRITARRAGALYLLSAIAAGVPLLYVPGAFVVDGNRAATAHNVLGSEKIVRMCMAGELLGAILFLFAVRALYRLFYRVNQRRAFLMFMFVLISIPITFLNVLNELAALTLLHGPEYLDVFNLPQRQALALFFLNLHTQGSQLDTIFWGLWLFPFGALVLRSRAIPRLLGFWLIANGAALIAVGIVGLFFPRYGNLATRLAIAPELGELWIMAWLLIKGVRVPLAMRRTTT
jgi:hypothetical protein